jgi:hypothetical protein
MDLMYAQRKAELQAAEKVAELAKQELDDLRQVVIDKIIKEIKEYDLTPSELFPMKGNYEKPGERGRRPVKNSVSGVIYDSRKECVRMLGISIHTLNARLANRYPSFNDWYTLGSKKDPNSKGSRNVS